MKTVYRDAILLLMMCLFWAINYPLVKIAVMYENEFYVLFFRILFALILSLILFPRSLILEGSLKTQIKLFTLSMLNIVGFMEFWFIGEMTESASISSIIIYSYPLIVVLLSIFFLGERVKALNFLGIIIGLFGIFLIFSEEIQVHSIEGLLFLILSALSWSFGTIFYKKYLKGIEPVKINTMQFIYALPVTFIFAIISGPIDFSKLNMYFFAVTIYMGTLGTSIAWFIYLILYRKYSVSKISSYLFLVPALSVISSFLILKESLNIFTFIGLGTIMFGIYLSQNSNLNNKMK